MKFEGTDYSRRTCISITANVFGLGEVAFVRWLVCWQAMTQNRC